MTSPEASRFLKVQKFPFIKTEAFKLQGFCSAPLAGRDDAFTVKLMFACVELVVVVTFLHVPVLPVPPNLKEPLISDFSQSLLLSDLQLILLLILLQA